MKRRYFIYLATMGCMCWSACSEHEAIVPEQVAEEISLSAVVDEVKLLSRALNDGAYTGTVPSADNELEASVWFSLTPGYYPENLPDDATDAMKKLEAETNIPVHGVINYVSGTATFPESTSEADKPKYPVGNESVYCVGLYPSDEQWTLGADSKTVSRNITGNKDLMFAPEIKGSWNSHFGSQQYRHLLTWLKVCVCTTTSEAGNYWGKLKKITLKNVPKSLTIDLAKAEGSDFDLKNTITYSTEQYNPSIFEHETGIDLAITTKEVASVFCHPSSTYTISIECENGKTIDKKIELTALKDDEKGWLDYPAGLQYVLILYFHPYNVVEGVCTLNAWNAQNEDLYPDN